jgi:hypothetical protein
MFKCIRCFKQRFMVLVFILLLFVVPLIPTFALTTPTTHYQNDDYDDDCTDADGDGWCDEVYYDEDCTDADGDGWCDEVYYDDDCTDADNDGWCDEVYYDEDCTDADGDGWCDDVYYDDDCTDADGDGWCDESFTNDTTDGDYFEWVDDCTDADGDGWCDDVYIDEYGDFVTDESFNNTFTNSSEVTNQTPLVSVDVSNSDISNSLSGDGLTLWNTVISIVPQQWVQNISNFEVFSNYDEGAGYVYIDEQDPSKFVLGLNVQELQDPQELVHTIVHELAHIVTLNTAQVDDNATTCSTLDLAEGCSVPTSYINQFNSQFWANGASSNGNAFVSDYASTNVAEDIAESFTAFVLQDRPTGNSIADQKINFFYNYPEMVALRSELRQNIANTR